MNGLPDRAAALRGALIAIVGLAGIAALTGLAACSSPGADDGGSTSHNEEIGRASCRERV